MYPWRKIVKSGGKGISLELEGKKDTIGLRNEALVLKGKNGKFLTV